MLIVISLNSTSHLLTGLTYIDLEEYDLAKIWLVRARDTYTGFLVESLVHLRIHGALAKLRQLRKGSTGNSNLSPSSGEKLTKSLP